jgi:hypothetical protein
VAGLIVPALIGVFWGAPLIAREFEQGVPAPDLEPVGEPGPLAGRQAGRGGPGRLISLAITWWAGDMEVYGDAPDDQGWVIRNDTMTPGRTGVPRTGQLRGVRPECRPVGLPAMA